MKWFREIRLVPLAMVGIAALLALKAAGLILDGGYSLGKRMDRGETMTVTTMPASNAIKLRSETIPLDLGTSQPRAAKPWAQEMLYQPDVTGSVPAAKPPADANTKPPEPKPPETKPAANVPAANVPAANVPAVEPPPPPSISPSERAVLERLQERRQQLDARARELDMRENLLKAAEQKLDMPGKPGKPDPKNPNAQPNGPRKDDSEAARFKSLVTMYETMKPKDAAKIFDRLDIKVLIEVSSLMNPRKMSDILAQMTPAAAERLTVELANRAFNPDDTPTPTELPKIVGKPTGG